MGKKKSSAIGFLYLIGMALAAIGFCIPMFSGFAASLNGFKFINFDNGGFTTVGALLVFAGAVAGLLLAVFGLAGIKIPSAKLLKLICLIVSVVGGIVLVIGFNDNRLYKAIAKNILKHADVGFYMVLAGWVVSICGVAVEK